MFKNVGKKLKDVASAFYLVVFFMSIIAGVIMIATDEELILAGIGVIAGGVFGGYIISLIIAAFGELVCSAVESEFYLKILIYKVEALEKKDSNHREKTEDSVTNNGNKA